MYSITPYSRLSRAPGRLHCPCRATITTRPSTATPPRLDDVTLMKPINIAIDDPSSLRSTWSHRAWVATGFASVLTSLAKSVAAAADSGSFVEPLLAAYVGYVLADLGSGVFHWAIDNYGGPSTPVFGSQIDAFQGHHRWPWTITRREFANNLHALARAVTFAVLPIELLLNAGGGAASHAFVGTCAGCVMLSQQFHAWAHEKKSRLPVAVVALQEAGVLVPRPMHQAHHREPYNNNYCIVSGAWNGVLDEYKVFEAIEMAIFFRFGVRPRSWSEPRSEWREEAEDTTTA
ncbi:fatty acid desaturase 4, chloroplastic-like [Canna indica]|uniref:Fatty acid desaturase 4, chloroplastic-like n=1 Tax=Canna indica TaxID=4628 RepID=A0AAQ3Q9Q2_9LILI|nr:fatty acid desaturase 4, chloroplastic-like [Canna indica]